MAQDTVEKNASKRSKKRAKQKNKENIASIEASSSAAAAPDKVLGVFVHYSDCLGLDARLLHPCVKVLLVNLANGERILKQHKDSRVTCYEEGNVEHILPLMTQPFAFRASRTMVPRWEELLIFNESFRYLSHRWADGANVSGAAREADNAQTRKTATPSRENLGLFFLVQDFVSMTRVNNVNNSSGGRRSGEERGWRDVAWAFLKLFPSPDSAEDNTERRLRLQLFKPGNRKPQEQENEAKTVWNWWVNRKLVRKAPASIYVTVQAIAPPSAANSETRGILPTDPPLSGTSPAAPFVQPQDESSTGPNLSETRPPMWTRAPGQACRLPKTFATRLDSGGRGVSAARFSADGRHLALAAAASNGRGSVISVFDFSAGAAGPFPRLMTFGGHSGPVYELDWADHRTLLSASSDGTAQVWYLDRGQREVLEHPTFVYCARFHPSSSGRVVVTGGYDRVVRIWKRQDQHDEHHQGGGDAYAVAQELVEHEAYVTALELDADGQNLYSADQKGVIKVWEVFGEKANLFFRLKRQLRLSMLAGYAVEALRLHPGGRRVLVQSASPLAPLVMTDLKQGTIMQEYRADVERRPRAGCCVTPCGSFVLAGGKKKDGGSLVYAWDTDTGVQRHLFDVGTDLPDAHIVCFHPMDHLALFAALAMGQAHKEGSGGPPALVYKYSKETTDIV